MDESAFRSDKEVGGCCSRVVGGGTSFGWSNESACRGGSEVGNGTVGTKEFAFVSGLVGVFIAQILQIVRVKFDFGRVGHCILIGST